MNIENIAVVRATNDIPFDGVLNPLSNVPYLCKNISGEFEASISKWLEELKITPEQDYSKIFEDNYYDNYVHECAETLKDYIPYVSDYNSLILFSLNGICPDDNTNGHGGNIFSNKKCAVIDSLAYHIEKAVSIVPTDTAIKGDVELSEEAIILIEEEIFDNLTEEQKIMLSGLKLNIKLFKGSLKDAIKKELQQSGKYIPEELSLSSSSGGFIESETSEMQKEFINKIAHIYGLSKLKYYNLITSRDGTDIPKYDEVKDEYSKAFKVKDYYIEKFLTELLNTINAPEEMKQQLHRNLHNRIYMEQIVELLKPFGIENYKIFVDQYNKNLEFQQVNGTLLTPEQIVNDSINNNLKM